MKDYCCWKFRPRVCKMNSQRFRGDVYILIYYIILCLSFNFILLARTSILRQVVLLTFFFVLAAAHRLYAFLTHDCPKTLKISINTLFLFHFSHQPYNTIHYYYAYYLFCLSQIVNALASSKVFSGVSSVIFQFRYFLMGMKNILN